MITQSGASPAKAYHSGRARAACEFIRLFGNCHPRNGSVNDIVASRFYDPSDNKIGEIVDVLVDQEGRVNALIIGVGGFLGAGEKDVAVPFNAVHGKKKDNKWWLVMNTTKDALKNAPGYKYDSNKTQWVPDKS
jgi:hypothetical protein